MTLTKTKLTKEPKWITIFQSTEEYNIRIYKLKLDEHEIPALIFDQRDSSYNAFGYIYLQVRYEDEEKAIKLLNLDHE